MGHFTTVQLQSITGGLPLSIRNVHVCLSRPRSTSPTSVNSDPLHPPPIPFKHHSSSLLRHRPKRAKCIIWHQHPHPPLSLPLSAISVHSCGLSPQAVMQSSNSCAQSQGLELARRAVQGRHHKKLSWKATGEERRERGD